MASVKKRGKNTYLITVSNGYDYKGTKLTETKTVHIDPVLSPKKYQAELDRLTFEFEQQIEKGLYLEGSKITFAEFAERWMKEYALKNLEIKTTKRYRELLDSRILPAIGHIKLDKLQPTHLISFYNNLREAGMRLDEKYIAKPDLKELVKSKCLTLSMLAEKSKLSELTVGNALRDKKVMLKSAKKIANALNVNLKTIFVLAGDPGELSSNTVHHHHSLISSILNDAVEWQIIVANPADRVPVPKVEKKVPKHYTKWQTQELLKALENESMLYKTMIILDAFTGLRTGEFMGLDWNNVDFESKTIFVDKVSQYITGYGTFEKERPKNDHSIRTLSIPPFIVSLLKAYKVWWNEQKLACGDLWQKSNRLFVTWDGRPLYTYALGSWLPAFLKKSNLPKISPHGLRHTFATLLAEKIPIPELSKLLGHGKPSTTSDIYVHFLKPENSAAGEMLEDMLISKTETENLKQG